MKHLNSKVSVIVFFVVATSLLVFYLLSIRWQIYLPTTFFWIAVASMLGTITYQILRVELRSSYVKVVLLEISITALVFHLIYVIPLYGLAGYDAYFDMSSAKGILSSGFVLGDPKYINLSSTFPMIHILGAILSMIAGIDIFSVAQWFSPLIGVAVIPLLYLLTRSIFKEEKVALLSALLFACLQNQILFSSQFIRETFALVLAVGCLYLYFSAKHSPHPVANYALSIMCLIGTVFAHHLTSLMLLILLSVHFLVTKASEVPFFRRAYFGNNITGEKVTIAFLLIAFTATLAYWTYVVTFPLYSLVTFARSVLVPSLWGVGTYAETAGISAASIRTIRGNVISYGFYSFLLIFGLILSYGLLPRAKNRRVETYSFSLFLLLCGLVGFLSLYIVAPAAFPDRFLTFGWLFGFAPLTIAILKGKYKWLRRIGVLSLVAFMLFNIYMIDPSFWNAKKAQEPSGDPTLQGYALVNTINFSSGNILSNEGSILGVIYGVHNNVGTLIYYNSVINVTNSDWVIINKPLMEAEKSQYPDSETIALLERLAFATSPAWNKIYESNNLVVATPSGGS